MTVLIVALVAQVNLSLLRPASGSDGLLGVEGAHPLTNADFPLELQLGFDAAWLPVRRAPRVDRRLGGWVQLAARLNDDFQLFAQLPATLGETGEVSATGFGVGDIRLGLRRGVEHFINPVRRQAFEFIRWNRSRDHRRGRQEKQRCRITPPE